MDSYIMKQAIRTKAYPAIPIDKGGKYRGARVVATSGWSGPGNQFTLVLGHGLQAVDSDHRRAAESLAVRLGFRLSPFVSCYRGIQYHS